MSYNYNYNFYNFPYSKSRRCHNFSYSKSRRCHNFPPSILRHLIHIPLPMCTSIHDKAQKIYFLQIIAEVVPIHAMVSPVTQYTKPRWGCVVIFTYGLFVTSETTPGLLLVGPWPGVNDFGREIYLTFLSCIVPWFIELHYPGLHIIRKII
jgi:hypothetical protein